MRSNSSLMANPSLTKEMAPINFPSLLEQHKVLKGSLSLWAENTLFWRQTWIQMLTPALYSCLTFGELLNLPDPNLLHSKPGAGPQWGQMYRKHLPLERTPLLKFFLSMFINPLQWKNQALFIPSGRDTNNLRYADDTTLMSEIEEELKSLLMRWKRTVKKLA